MQRPEPSSRAPEVRDRPGYEVEIWPTGTQAGRTAARQIRPFSYSGVPGPVANWLCCPGPGRERRGLPPHTRPLSEGAGGSAVEVAVRVFWNWWVGSCAAPYLDGPRRAPAPPDCRPAPSPTAVAEREPGSPTRARHRAAPARPRFRERPRRPTLRRDAEAGHPLARLSPPARLRRHHRRNRADRGAPAGSTRPLRMSCPSPRHRRSSRVTPSWPGHEYGPRLFQLRPRAPGTSSRSQPSRAELESSSETAPALRFHAGEHARVPS